METRNKKAGFRPQFAFPSASDIPVEFFTSLGVRAVVFDVDNTITRWELKNVPEEMLSWIDGLKRAGFALAMLSNGTRSKLASVEEQTGIKVVPGKKPFLSTFLRCRDFLGVPHEKIAIVGDQCVTDIWPANRLGWITILVEPMSARDFLGTHIYRGLERMFGMRSAINS